MNIKKSFEKLSIRETIQLYLIVIMIYGLIFVFYKEISALVYPMKSYEISNIKVSKDNKNYTKKLSDLELLTYFNKHSRDSKVDIKETKISKNSIDIKMIGAYTNTMNLLNTISYNFKIKQFEIKKVDNKIELSIRLERQTFLIMSSSELKKEEILNPFMIKSLKKYKESKIIVSAIVDLEILVNNNWYKKGDRIKEYLVLLIKKDEVFFLNTKTKKKIVKSIIYE